MMGKAHLVRAQLQSYFREAAGELEPDQEPSVSARLISAWTLLQWVMGGRRFGEAAEAALAQVDPQEIPIAERADWLLAASRLWVQRASAVVRKAAFALSEALPDHPESVPAALFYWRITGERRWLRWAQGQEQALLKAPLSPQVKGLWALHCATARPDLAELCVAALGGYKSAELPLDLWPLAADALSSRPEDFAHSIQQWEHSPPAPADLIPAAAALSLEPLELRIGWWIEQELFEGPVAEAATFPYPALRLRFFRLDRRDQVQITPILGGVPEDTVYDIGVIAAVLDEVAAQADLSGLRSPPRRRSPRGSRTW